MNKHFYFDYASSTPIDAKVLKSVEDVRAIAWANPSAEHTAGRAARVIRKDALERMARSLQVRPSELIVTSGATEANNMALCLPSGQDHHTIVSSIEHASVLAAAQYRANYSLAPVDDRGIVDIQKLASLIREDTALISIMLVNNEIGTIQPLKDIVELVATCRLERQKSGNKTPLYVHTDAVQALNTMSFLPTKLGVDLATVSSGKIYGPKSIGLLYVNSKVRLVAPLLHGGGQQRGLRSGTEDVATTHGFSAALEYAAKHAAFEQKRLTPLYNQFLHGLADLPVATNINGSTKRRIVSNVNVSFAGHDAERLAFQLDDHGIAVATGAACSAASDKASHVLSALGIDEGDIRASLRFSFGRDTDEKSIIYCLEKLNALLR